MDIDGIFDGVFSNNFQETSTIPVYAVARVNHKAIIHKGFHNYLNHFQKINSHGNGIIFQLLQVVFFALYVWNIDPVYTMEIA